MKNLFAFFIIIIQLFIAIFIAIAGFILATYSYNALFLFPSSSEKKIEVIEVKVKTFTSMSSCKKEQAYNFSKLIRKLKENPDFFKRIKVDLAHGSDPISMEKPPATIKELENWRFYDFIYLEFPDGFLSEQSGIFSINCFNYDKKNIEFSAAIKTVRETSYGSSERSICYFVAKTGKESMPEIEKQAWILQAIEDAIHSIPN
ncbi:hypothetical protein A3B93_01625 [Candidatus Nomurabacteria bacterium RIFCSPHIGHO2_02_FULL_42_24]|uniref:Uncharacterized protein n=1 Tax=Candidatus Nomurabacteria bacterium RIFCSPHIGHO2_02_FULL_42_24 TaxID=1801757 RepID=A0A1F6WIU6_9BACT|nr:MAG: hypothetical protein UV08_C0032G0019 [Parcubacteria group bacterium GW2011_GWA2_42_18]OGI81635.1 MAG: hypothetical protein A3B93_01625 [Candidatus Nomurabacteria bacterium RIFCSPHIGHO2_02_FULL_42_24]